MRVKDEKSWKNCNREKRGRKFEMGKDEERIGYNEKQKEGGKRVKARKDEK